MQSDCIDAIGGSFLTLKAAIERFGLTDNPFEAGWILSDGRMLDFSEKNEGGPGGERTLDHRAVVCSTDERTSQGQVMGLFAVYNRAVRISMMRGSRQVNAQVYAKMTSAQRNTLLDAIEWISSLGDDADAIIESVLFDAERDFFEHGSTVEGLANSGRAFWSRKLRQINLEQGA